MSLSVGARVRLIGLVTKPELNGCEGVCSVFCEDSGRWTVRLHDGKEMALKISNLVDLSKSGSAGADETMLSSGVCVELVKLEARPELNGLRGAVVAHVPESGRWTVRLDDDRQLALKSSNLKIIGSCMYRDGWPLCKNGCGCWVPLAVKPSGFPYETCCRSCAESNSHDSNCPGSAPYQQAPTSASLSSDSDAVAFAVQLFQAVVGEGGSADKQELEISARVLQDRLHFWPSELQHFIPVSGDFSALSAKSIAAPGCPWICHLDAHYKHLGRRLFAQVCGAQAKALQAFRRQRGARILDKGLKANDYLQQHSLTIVDSVWGSAHINRALSQEYYDRATTRIIHSGTLSEYTPPSRGPITSNYWKDMGISEEQMTANVERVVRVALVNDAAQFDESHVPLYHGLAARSFADWKKSGPSFVAYPGKFGDGIYLTPSFQMACMYAFRQPRTLAAASSSTGLAAPRFAATPDGKWNYIMCYQVMTASSAIEKFSGTAFKDAGDGWDLEEQINIVRNPAQAQIYGILFCYFPRTFVD